MSTGNCSDQRNKTPSIKREQYHRIVRSQHLKQKFSSARKAILAQSTQMNKNINLHQQEFLNLLNHLEKDCITYSMLKKLWQMIKENCFLVDLFKDEQISKIMKYGLALIQNYCHSKYHQLCMVLLVLINWYGKQNQIKFFDMVMLLLESAFNIKNQYAIMQFIIILLGNIISETEVKKKTIELKLIEKIVKLDMDTALIEDTFFVLVNFLSEQNSFPSELLKKIWYYCEECYQYLTKNQNCSTIFYADMLRIVCKLSSPTLDTQKQFLDETLPFIIKLISQAIENDLQKKQKYQFTIWKTIEQLLHYRKTFTSDMIDKILLKLQKRITKINVDIVEDPQQQLNIRSILWSIPTKFTLRQKIKVFAQWCLDNIENYGLDFDNTRRAIIFLSSEKNQIKTINLLDILVNKIQDYQNQEEMRETMLNKIYQMLIGLPQPNIYIQQNLMSILNKLQFDENQNVRESVDKILKLGQAYCTTIQQKTKSTNKFQQEV